MLIDYLGWLVALIVAVVFYKKGLKIVRPYWAYRNDNIIQKQGQSDKPIKILYDNKEVEQVTSTSILIWNRGKDAVLGEKIPKSDPLCFLFPDGVDVLKIDVPKKTRDSIDFKITNRPDEDGHQTIECSFNFLDHNDGVVIEAVHTGDQNTEIFCRGTILGARRGAKKLSMDPDRGIRYMVLSLLIMSGIVGLTYLIPESRDFWKALRNSNFSFVFGAGFGFVGMLAGPLIYVYGGQSRVPKEIRGFLFHDRRINPRVKTPHRAK